MAQLASQVQASIGVNPFCGSALPLQNSIASRYAPIQPAVATRRLVPVGGLDASQYWNNASQPAFSSASYEIPSNWTGGLSQGANANSATVSNARTMKKNSGSRTNSKSTASAIAVPLMTTSSIVPPDHFLDLEHTNEGERVPRRQSFSDSISTDAESVKPKTSATAKAKQNRERNREHARSTRLRKKAYVQKLKEMADGLRAIQTDEIRQRRLAVHQMTEMQKTRKRLIQKFLEYHASYEEDPQAWASLVEDNFWLKQPVTPFRSFRRSEVERVCL